MTTAVKTLTIVEQAEVLLVQVLEDRDEQALEALAAEPSLRSALLGAKLYEYAHVHDPYKTKRFFDKLEKEACSIPTTSPKKSTKRTKGSKPTSKTKTDG